MKLIDLTHTFTADMPVFPGDPKATLEQVAYLEKDTFNDHQLTSVMHVGTHMDAPLHMLKDGKTINEIPLETFIGNGVLIDARGKKQIDSLLLKDIKIKKDDIVLLFSGFGEKYRSTDYFENAPVVTEDFAQALIKSEIKMLAMDMSGPDHDTNWPIHKLLLGKHIMIVENTTNMEQLLDVSDFEVFAFPMKLQADASPVRIMAKINTT